ncbi:MAG: SPOR domain-containing protein [Candidatus Adiutrix sp.]|jgi:hypothetical protein|nr:SPOR domain-containing protein [Candidatus Adiutrix sp.]
MKIFRLLLTLALLALPLRPGLLAAAEDEPGLDGFKINPRSYDGDLTRRSLDGSFSASFTTALVARSDSEEAAGRLAAKFRNRGLAALAIKKDMTGVNLYRNIFKNEPPKLAWIVTVGLFGRREETDALGQRLRADGSVKDYRIMGLTDQADLEAFESQNSALYAQAANTSQESQKRAGRPLDPQSPQATGEAFHNYVQGRFIGSYRDPLEAREVARQLTTSGWSASVERAGQWNRVYLAPTRDSRDLRADPAALSTARKSAASQPGLIFLADLSSLAGQTSLLTPNAERSNASACGGFSEFGRLSATLTRTIIYIPETAYTVALVPIQPRPMSWRDIPQLARDWWDDKNRPVTKAVYGPAIFNRPEMEQAINQLQNSPDQASLALGLAESSVDLATIPGRKVLLVFSEFQAPDQPEDIREAVSHLKGNFGDSLEIIYIYGDANGDGYRLAERLAKEAQGGPAWDGCRLLSDNAYFEQYIKTIFK